MSAPRIIINNLSFHLEHTSVFFSDISMCFESLKYGIVGDNGVGKTTFLKLLLTELLPDEGSIQCDGKINFVPQSHVSVPQEATFYDVLGVTEIIDALARINQGNSTAQDFDKVSDNWDIESRIEQALQAFQLWPIDLDTLFASLSGGQKTKVLLAKTLIFPADFVIFDEPTNNLDKQARDELYRYVDAYNKGMIVVSHDRKLLNKMDVIIEMSTKGISLYGGNYDFYHQQKELELQALQQDYLEAQQSITQTKRSIQSTRERHEKSQSKGKAQRKSGGQAKIILDAMKSRSEKTKAKMTTQEDKMITEKQANLLHIREKIEIKQDMNISLDATRVPNGKVVLKIEHLLFHYTNQARALFKDFDLTIVGPERVALLGPNGSGKSTLIKLIRQQINPFDGIIDVGVEHVSYLDQGVSFLNHDLTLVDNFLKLNPNTNAFDAYSALAQFNFRNKAAEKTVASLSGGEKMRAGLAISLMSTHPPQLIILDEPTNHLDLASIEAIENMLKLYQGAILAVSHDDAFLENIGIDRKVTL